MSTYFKFFKLSILSAIFIPSMIFALDTNIVTSKATSYDNKNGILKFNASNLKVGESGIVIQKISEELSSIVAKVQITKVENGVASAKIIKFDTLNQKYLPSIEATPKVGDSVRFRDFYDKAFIIAPNQEDYESVRDSNKSTYFLNSDLVAAHMRINSVYAPMPKDFGDVCRQYGAGLLYILNSSGLNIVECETFAILEKRKFKKSAESQVPFFSRIEPNRRGSIGRALRLKDIKNYYGYYDDLLKNR